MTEMMELMAKISEYRDTLKAQEGVGIENALHIMSLCELLKTLCIEYLRRRV